MEVNKIYQELQDLINKNSSYKGSPITKRQFVDLYNNVSITYIVNLLKNRNLDDLRYLTSLRKSKELDKGGCEDKYCIFKLPKDYLSIINLSSEFKGDGCLVMSEHLEEVRPEEVDIYYNDSNTEPSIDYGESIYTLYNGGIKLFKKNFEINKAVLDYYKTPEKIDIKGYKKSNGSDSVDLTPTDLPQNIILNIISEMALKFVQSVENTTQWQMLNSNK
jgi:hypothetical protein